MGLIAERLAYLRKQRKWTQAELAERLHIKQQEIARYEIGERSPKVDTIARMADALGCTVSYLIGRSPLPEGTLAELDPAERELIAAIRRAASADEIDALVLRCSEAQAAKNRKPGRKR